MARIRHIALTTENPSQTAEFYKQAFGLKELRRSRNGAVFLTDGYIHLAVLNHKDERSPDMGAHGPKFSGIHHFGFAVDDLGEACTRLDEAMPPNRRPRPGRMPKFAPVTLISR